jgi:putative membrane protein
LLIGIVLLEIWPMVTFIRWRIAGGRGQAVETSRAGLFSWISTAQAIMLVVMVVLATGMARGLGMG